MEPALTRAIHGERGSALVAALAGTVLMLALGSALVLITATEVRIGARYARGAEVLSATELVLDRALLELLALADWNLALNGTASSSLTDGPAAGVRQVGDVSIDLGILTESWRCGRVSCIGTDPAAVGALRPWGRNNPYWQPFAWTAFDAVLAGTGGAGPVYVIVWVADDPGETDGDPLRDGATEENPGRDTVVVLAEGRGATGLRRVLEAAVRRTRNPETGEPDGMERLAWREVR